MRRPLLVNAADLLRRPGSLRDVDTELTAGEVDLDDDRLVPGEPIRIRLELESLSDGIVVVGSLGVRWRSTCRRCLRAIDGDLELQVHELYQVVVTDPDAFEIVGDQLDLVPMVRETVLLDLPTDPLCSPTCAGLCPGCGVDRNAAPCGCDTSVIDERWSTLDQLRDQLLSEENLAGPPAEVAGDEDPRYPQQAP